MLGIGWGTLAVRRVSFEESVHLLFKELHIEASGVLDAGLGVYGVRIKTADDSGQCPGRGFPEKRAGLAFNDMSSTPPVP